ncbi:hypothetical protein U1Q18_026217 [Sarracenia purpurea var. burkii]
MEAFSLLNIWCIAAGKDISGGGSSDTYIPMTSSGMIVPNVSRQAEKTDEGEDSFFDLEFTVPVYDEKEHNDARDVDVNASESDEDSYSNWLKRIARAGPISLNLQTNRTQSITDFYIQKVFEANYDMILSIQNKKYPLPRIVLSEKTQASHFE